MLVSDLDLECKMWLKLRLAPMCPWIGTISLAFVGPPNVKVQLSPYNRVRLMRVPVVQNYLRKLLTVDLPGAWRGAGRGGVGASQRGAADVSAHDRPRLGVGVDGGRWYRRSQWGVGRTARWEQAGDWRGGRGTQPVASYPGTLIARQHCPGRRAGSPPTSPFHWLTLCTPACTIGRPDLL